MGVRLAGQHLQLDGLEAAPVGKGQRQGVPALEAVEGVGALPEWVGQPEVFAARLENLFVAVGEPEEQAVAARFERLVERQVLQPVHFALAHGDLPSRILGTAAQDLDQGVVLLVPEGAHGGFVVVDDAVLERGADGGRDPLFDPGRVAHDGLVQARPVGECRNVQLAGHRILEGVRRNGALGGGRGGDAGSKRGGSECGGAGHRGPRQCGPERRWPDNPLCDPIHDPEGSGAP